MDILAQDMLSPSQSSGRRAQDERRMTVRTSRTNQRYLQEIQSTTIPTTTPVPNSSFPLDKRTPEPSASTDGLLTTTLPKETPSPTSIPVPTSKTLSTFIVPSSTLPMEGSVSLSTGITAGIVVCTLFLAGFIAHRLRRAQRVSLTFHSTVSSQNSLHLDQLHRIRVNEQDITITKPLAIGAYGAIHSGIFLDQVVAVKTCTKNSLSDVQSFVDELILMSKLSSPYIVRLIGVAWTKASNIQAVLEIMDMGDLRDWLASNAQDSATFRWKIECVKSVAEALAYLSTKQIIHRDLKSRNVLLDSTKGTKLADFGIAKEETTESMTTGVGTYRWMAPEILAFRHYTAAVDIYSFGVLLTELDTHLIPYNDIKQSSSVSDTAIVAMVLHQGLRPTLSKNCPQWLKDLALQCMSSDPASRPKPCELVEKLKYVLGNKD